MLTYSLSTREKILVLFLALVLVAIAWFALVFQRTGDEIASLESQISNIESEIDVDQARAAQIDSMKKAIEEYEKSGKRSVEVPAYDNMTPLMVELNGVMVAAETYSISFDEISLDAAKGYVQRGVKLDFTCVSYDAAKAIVNELANGKFPCVIDSVSITDNSASGSGRPSSSKVSASLHLTYLEKR